MERRTVLAAGLGAAFLAACTRGKRLPSAPSASPSPSPTLDPDVTVLLAWSESEQRLAGLYAPLLRTRPRLAALRDNHRARADAVAERLRARGTAPPVVGPPPLPSGAALVAAEAAAVTAYLGTLARVSDGDLATLGAELAAGARQHATVLRLALA